MIVDTLSISKACCNSFSSNAISVSSSTLVYHAAVRGIEIEAVESSYTGDMDVRGLFGLSDDVRKGFSKVAVNMRVRSEASVEELTEMALYSPVYDIVSNSLPVEYSGIHSRRG